MPIDTIQADNDYGAYQSTFKAMFLFPPDQWASVCMKELPRLIRDLPDWAGEILNSLVCQGTHTKAFNVELGSSQPHDIELVCNFVKSEENDGWLEGFEGEIKVCQ